MTYEEWEEKLLSTYEEWFMKNGDMFIGLFCLLRYVGRLYVKSTGKPVEILKRLNELAGFDPDEEIELYEVCFSSIFRSKAYWVHIEGIWGLIVNQLALNFMLSLDVAYGLG